MPRRKIKKPRALANLPISQRLLMAVRPNARRALNQYLKQTLFHDALQALSPFARQSDDDGVTLKESRGLRDMIKAINPKHLSDEEVLFIILSLIQHHKNKDPEGRRHSNGFFRSIAIQSPSGHKDQDGMATIHCKRCPNQKARLGQPTRYNRLYEHYKDQYPIAVGNVPHATIAAHAHYRQVHQPRPGGPKPKINHPSLH